MKIKMFTIPNMITLLNLLCGCLAAMYAFQGDLQIAFLLVAAAAVFDFLDGFAARLLRQYSEIGKQLDSLADVVSFGVAPSAVLLSMFQTSGGTGSLGWAVFLLAGFSALRLARFNIDETQTDEFRGMPTPACALLVTSCGYLYASGLYAIQPWMTLAATAVLCFLLVCPLRMFSLKFHSWGLRENALRYGFAAASLSTLILLGITAVPFIFIGYVVVSAMRALVCAKH